MNIIRHIPAWADIDEKFKEPIEFNDYNSLLNIPFVKNWTQQPGFKNFVQKPNGNGQVLLLAVIKKDNFVVGYLNTKVEETL